MIFHFIAQKNDSTDSLKSIGLREGLDIEQANKQKKRDGNSYYQSFELYLNNQYECQLTINHVEKRSLHI